MFAAFKIIFTDLTYSFHVVLIFPVTDNDTRDKPLWQTAATGGDMGYFHV